MKKKHWFLIIIACLAIINWPSLTIFLAWLGAVIGLIMICFNQKAKQLYETLLGKAQPLADRYLKDSEEILEVHKAECNPKGSGMHQVTITCAGKAYKLAYQISKDAPAGLVFGKKVTHKVWFTSLVRNEMIIDENGNEYTVKII